MRTTKERFEEKIDRTPGHGPWGDCHLWTGARRRPAGRPAPYGQYGQLFVEGRVLGAHRVAWEAEHGPIPAGLWVLHHCDNPPCVNPAHLFLGTRLDNMGDCSAKNRCHPGERNHTAKLLPDQVREIRLRSAAGEQQQALAAEYGVSGASVSLLVSRKTWGHIA